jgi:hypothetical protein
LKKKPLRKQPLEASGIKLLITEGWVDKNYENLEIYRKIIMKLHSHIHAFRSYIKTASHTFSIVNHIKVTIPDSHPVH